LALAKVFKDPAPSRAGHYSAAVRSSMKYRMYCK
jgi:hypothetical protein